MRHCSFSSANIPIVVVVVVVGVVRPFITRYRIFKSLFSHMYQSYRGKQGERELGYRETWNSTTVTLVLLRPRSKGSINGTDILRPHPTEEARKTVSVLKDTPHPA